MPPIFLRSVNTTSSALFERKNIMSFQEYPKRMVHKDHTQAVFKPLTEEEQKMKGLFASIPQLLTPERFADITVSNLDQEKQYASKGYRPASGANMAEYEQAILDQKPHDGYVLQAFPKYKYHAFNMPVVVKDAAAEAALGEGWEDSPVIATEDDIESENVALQTKASWIMEDGLIDEQDVAKPAKKKPAKAAKKKPKARKAKDTETQLAA